jgi:archaemetzincin
MILALLTLAANPSPAAPLSIHLIPCGPVKPGIFEVLKEGLKKELGTQVTRGEGMALPEGAYDSHRRQYRAEAFLPSLAACRRDSRELVLGVTEVDLYIRGLNFVFGLAHPGEKCAIISLARLNPQFYGEPAAPGLLGVRALKEAVHELGHLLGLGHCPEPSCIMFFSNSLMDTDRKGPGFCPRCQVALKRG